MNDIVAELLVAEITGGRKGRVVFCPVDVVIAIPLDGAVAPVYVTPLIYVRKALIKYCNPVIVFFLLFIVIGACFSISGVLRFSTLAIRNPLTLALTLRNLPFNLPHSMSLFWIISLLRLCCSAEELEYSDTDAFAVSDGVYYFGADELEYSDTDALEVSDCVYCHGADVLEYSDTNAFAVSDGVYCVGADELEYSDTDALAVSDGVYCVGADVLEYSDTDALAVSDGVYCVGADELEYSDGDTDIESPITFSISKQICTLLSTPSFIAPLMLLTGASFAGGKHIGTPSK